MMRRPVLAATAGLASVVLACAAPAQFAAAGVTHPAKSATSTFKLPYTDPQQAGLLTLCNEKLQPITHGLITTKPFVWRVVSSVPTPAGYRIKNATAVLATYQPRQYTPAGAWSGLIFTAASVYTNYSHPMVQLTPIDQPMDWMTESFPPLWDHLIELRMYLGGPDRAMYDDNYGAADIQIIGNTWKLVVGGHGSCTDGSATSREVLLNLPGASGTPTPGASSGGTGQSSTHSGSATASDSSSSPATGGATGSGSGTDAAASTSSESSVAPAAIVVGVLVVLALGAVALWSGRRRRRAGL
jgi:hypothetical protein